MATSEPSLPLGNAVTREQVPPDCTCGTKDLCPLHFVAEDFFPGAIVLVNPYSAAKYGIYPGDGYELGRVYHVATVREHGRYAGNLSITLVELPGKLYHHGHFIPDHFMSMFHKALREDEKRKADKERYYNAESQKTS
jgi:hypothetical protein